MYDNYDNEYNEENVKKIKFLYELRHCCNLFGIDFVSKRRKISGNKIEILYESNIHGSKELDQFISANDTQFRELVEKYEKKENERQQIFHEIQNKREILICNLKESRTTFAGIGTNKAKRRLNKLSLISQIAKAVRLALEIEDKNIVAKNTHYYYQDKVYDQKNKLIFDLCKLFKEQKWIYGIQSSDDMATSHIIYFEIPNCEQISWHFSPEKRSNEIPKYVGEWDKKENSTLRKLESTTKILLEEKQIVPIDNLKIKVENSNG